MLANKKNFKAGAKEKPTVHWGFQTYKTSGTEFLMVQWKDPQINPNISIGRLPQKKQFDFFDDLLKCTYDAFVETSVTTVKEIEINNRIFRFPTYLEPIFTEIIESKKILDLEYNWDENGAAKIKDVTFINCVEFLLNYGTYLYNDFDKMISVPDITPCADGTIDIFWENEKASLLLNFKTNKNIASYYGDTHSDINSIKGFINVNETKSFFASWISDFLI